MARHGWTDIWTDRYLDIHQSIQDSTSAATQAEEERPCSDEDEIVFEMQPPFIIFANKIFFFFQIPRLNPYGKQLKLPSNNYGLAYSKETNTATDIPKTAKQT